MLNQLIKPLLLLIAFTIPFWILWRYVVLKQARKVFLVRTEAIAFLFYLYILFLISITLLPLPMTRLQRLDVDSINLMPVINTYKKFKHIFDTVPPERRHRLPFVFGNIWGNIILFIPMGMLLPFMSAAFRKLKRIVLAALLVSVFIELAQFVERRWNINRYVDIDDVILNVMGAIIGYVLLAFLIKKLSGGKRRNNLESNQ